MAGLYIHIPFCRKACHYCNFHFSTSLEGTDKLIRAMVLEMEKEKDYTGNEPLQTIYFGGGTPSLLDIAQINTLFASIQKNFPVSSDAEVTLEANPDDLTPEKVLQLKTTPVNRFSIGVQSFYDDDLQWMNRAHKAAQAEESIRRVQDAGFSNITIDLIYGTPGLTDEKWMNNILRANDLGIDHISSYCLTIEPKTALDHLVRTGKYDPADEEQAARQFEILVNALESHGFEQYEISNFARNKKYAVHNTNYWKGIPYLGIGPSAHSFNKLSRRWNIANNSGYIRLAEKGADTYETEILSDNDRFNEMIMTGLRTIWGVDRQQLSSQFPAQFESIKTRLEKLTKDGTIEEAASHFRLARKARIFADGIASQLFADAQ